MHCEVNEQGVSASTVTYRDIGFGVPVSLPGSPYVLRYEISEVCGLLADAYRSFVQEMRADFELTGDRCPEYFHNLAYPPLDVLAQHEEEFGRIIHDFLSADLLRETFPGTGSDKNVQWIINGIDNVTCRDGFVELRGQVFQRVGFLK
jgi:hypothetical protein